MGIIFSKKSIAFVAPRISVHGGRSTIPGQIRGADFESDDCFLLEYIYMMLCRLLTTIYSYQNRVLTEVTYLHDRRMLSQKRPARNIIVMIREHCCSGNEH